MAAPIGVALIGAGVFAREEHIPAILSVPNLSLKAIYSRSLSSCAAASAALASKVDWYTAETTTQSRGLDDMLLNPNIKAVVVAVPITAQGEYVRKALEAGKSVLSEKPVAGSVEEGRGLVEWWRGDAVGELKEKGVTWSVAENWRWLGSLQFAAEECRRLGRVLGFRAQRGAFMGPGNKFFETAWRKAPTHQGGFLLDMGVHVTAALRLLLGEGDAVTRVSAFTAQLQEHLPPVDTINATLKTKTGISGTLAISAGTTFQGSGLTVACEGGTVTVGHGSVTVLPKDGIESVRSFGVEGSGVKEEIAAWAEGLAGGVLSPLLNPEEALMDLEILEAMLRSGERDGAPVDIGVA